MFSPVTTVFPSSIKGLSASSAPPRVAAYLQLATCAVLLPQESVMEQLGPCHKSNCKCVGWFRRAPIANKLTYSNQDVVDMHMPMIAPSATHPPACCAALTTGWFSKSCYPSAKPATAPPSLPLVAHPFVHEIGGVLCACVDWFSRSARAAPLAPVRGAGVGASAVPAARRRSSRSFAGV